MTQSQTWSIAFVLLSLFGLLSLLNVLSGISIVTSIESAAIIAIEGIAGLAIYFKCFPVRRSLFEAVGFAVAGGGLLSAISDQLFLLLIPINVGWLVPSLIATMVLAFSRSRSSLTELPGRRESFWFVGTLMIGCLMLAAFWRQNPLSWSGWWQHYGDLYFHEGVARSVAESGLDHNNWLDGYGLGYHWFGESWMGHFFKLIPLEHFASTSRLIYTTALLGSAGLAYGWSRRMTKIAWAPLVSIVLLFTSAYVAVSLGNTYGMVQGLYSPTHTFALLSLLALSVSMALALDKHFTYITLIPILIFSIGTGGGRITQTLVAGGGLAFLCLWLLLRKSLSRHKLIALAVAASGLLIGLFLAIRPWAHVIRWNQFEFYPNTQFASMLGLIPMNGPFGGSLGILATLLVLLPGFSGLLWLIYARRFSGSLAWAMGCAFAGIAAAFLTFQVGFSHVTFIFSGAAVALIPAGVGLSTAIQEIGSGSMTPKVGSRFLLGIAILGAVAGIAALFTYSWATGQRFEGPIHWITPLLLLAVAVILSIAMSVVAGSTRLFRGSFTVCVVLLSCSAISSGLGAAVAKFASPAPSYSASSPLSLSSSDLEAADWATANIPRSGLFATNRLCSDPALTPPTCQSSWLKVSVLTGRPVLIEGYSNGTGASLAPESPENSWILQRILPSWNFSIEPNLSDTRQLWDQGVRWIWIDKLQTKVRSWEPFAETLYENDSTAILRLRQP